MRYVLCCCALLLIQTAHSHHSSVGIYDEENLVEIEGVVTSLRWRNPHPTFTVEVEDENGESVEWEIETGSVSTLRLRGVERGFFAVGAQVRLAGQSSLRGVPEMFAQNMLLDDGREVLLRAVSKPYWPAGLQGILYERTANETRAQEGRRTAEGIFRVWSPIFHDPEAYPLYGAGDYPLTDAAQVLKTRWDPRSSPYSECTAKPMPYIMGSAYPIKFETRGDDLLIRIEEFDLERLIHIDEPRSSIPSNHSPLGYSQGRWEGETLIIETERIEGAILYGDGTPTSSAIQLVEEFSMNEAQDRLNYRVIITDPESFTETLDFTRYWVWQPDIQLQPYDCGNQL